MQKTLKKLTKNRIVVDAGALLEYFKLILDSYHHKLNEENQNRLIQLLELFKGRELIIVPQVLSETYSLLKKKAKRSDSQIKHWLEILEDPYLKGLLENYVKKDEISKKHVSIFISPRNDRLGGFYRFFCSNWNYYCQG